jgi:hypothetical protein
MIFSSRVDYFSKLQTIKRKLRFCKQENPIKKIQPVEISDKARAMCGGLLKVGNGEMTGGS